MQWYANHYSSLKSLVLSNWRTQFYIHCTTPMSTQHCGWSCISMQTRGQSYYARDNRGGGAFLKKIKVILFYGAITWYSTCLSQHMTLFYPLVPHIYQSHCSMLCMSWKVMVWQTCLPEINHSALFKLTCRYCALPSWQGISVLAFFFQLNLGALHWANKA